MGLKNDIHEICYGLLMRGLCCKWRHIIRCNNFLSVIKSASINKIGSLCEIYGKHNIAEANCSICRQIIGRPHEWWLIYEIKTGVAIYLIHARDDDDDVDICRELSEYLYRSRMYNLCSLCGLYWCIIWKLMINLYGTATVRIIIIWIRP